jgi:hypothetical protein
MADQSGSQIVTETAVQAGGEANPDALARADSDAMAEPGSAQPGTVATAEPGTLSEPWKEHEAFHGRPVSWVAVSIIIAGFLCGGLSLVFTAWVTFYVGAGLVVVGALLAAMTNMFEDWY